MRLRGRKAHDGALTHDLLQQYIDQKLAQAKHSRRAASDAARTIRTLAAAPVSTAEPVRPASETTAMAIDPQAEAPRPPRIEPQHLSIGSGYVGSL